jgi:hypothetical protein
MILAKSRVFGNSVALQYPVWQLGNPILTVGILFAVTHLFMAVTLTRSYDILGQSSFPRGFPFAVVILTYEISRLWQESFSRLTRVPASMSCGQLGNTETGLLGLHPEHPV